MLCIWSSDLGVLPQVQNNNLFGIVFNGDRWQFGKLEADGFARNITFYSLQNLDALFAAVHYLFQQYEVQLAEYATIA